MLLFLARLLRHCFHRIRPLVWQLFDPYQEQRGQVFPPGKPQEVIHFVKRPKVLLSLFFLAFFQMVELCFVDRILHWIPEHSLLWWLARFGAVAPAFSDHLLSGQEKGVCWHCRNNVFVKPSFFQKMCTEVERLEHYWWNKTSLNGNRLKI